MEVTGEQVGLLTTLGTPDLQDDRTAVIGIPGQQEGPKLALQAVDLAFKLGDLDPELVAVVAIG